MMVWQSRVPVSHRSISQLSSIIPIFKRIIKPSWSFVPSAAQFLLTDCIVELKSVFLTGLNESQLPFSADAPKGAVT
jgi:hypothetical protein